MATLDSNYPYAQGSPFLFQPETAVARHGSGRLKRWGRAVVFKEAGATKAWYGVLFLGAACSWLGYVGLRTLMSGGDLSFAISTARARAVGPVLLVFVAVILLAEQLWPAVPRPLLSRAHLVDAGYLVLFAAVVMPLLTLVETGFSVEIGRHAHFLLLGRLPLGPQVIASGLILIGIDAMNWGGHVANHRSLTLWRLHALHHSQEDMSVLTTFRTHPLIHASYLPSLFPALILGASGAVPGVAVIVYGCLITLPHANLRWKFGPLGRVFVSPAYHRLHHAASPLDERGTVNFGFVLVCWDQMIRRAAFPTNAAPVATGIAGRPVPVEQAGSARSTPRVMVAQLTQPFTIHAATDAPV
jgi:sterol desaturase/sphingolipid hydroxylase (fatty acid hydroxylase superfamily)